MSEGQRPGGLTALAIINFVLGGFGILALLAGVIGRKHMEAAILAGEIPGMTIPMFHFGLITAAIATPLLIISGIGYLGQKKIIGRVVGSLYAVIAITGSIIAISEFGKFEIINIVEFIYPAITLILINTTFKDDLVN